MLQVVKLFAEVIGFFLPAGAAAGGFIAFFHEMGAVGVTLFDLGGQAGQVMGERGGFGSGILGEREGEQGLIGGFKLIGGPGEGVLLADAGGHVREGIGSDAAQDGGEIGDGAGDVRWNGKIDVEVFLEVFRGDPGAGFALGDGDDGAAAGDGFHGGAAAGEKQVVIW